MAVYRGQINLINVNDGKVPDDLFGIVSVNSYYTISLSSEMPPDEELYTLVLNSGLLQLEPNCGANLYFKNNTLLASRDGQELDLIVDKSIIIGAGGSWTESIPAADPGMYMWSKTATSYSNDTIHVVYNVSRLGADGDKGDKGEPGEAELYEIRTNQKEILKFVDSYGKTTLSPQKIIVSIYKEDQYSDAGEYQITEGLSLENFELSVYDTNSGLWYDIETNVKEQFVTLDETSNFEIDLKSIIEQAEQNANYYFGNILLAEETVLKLYYFYTPLSQEGKKYSLSSYIDVRYGMNKDMASLKLQANGLVASMQNSKLVFNANGLTVQNGSFIIQNSEEDKLLYADENGNLSLKGNIFAENGYFKGELQGANGTFEGELVAASGTFKGKLEAVTGSFSGDISAASGTIGGFDITKEQLISKSINNSGLPNIILNGTEGIIEAENIILGVGAKIKEYIEIGESVQLKKADRESDSFISVKKENREILSLKANGTINVGDGEDTIIIAGADGTIMSQSYLNGLGWKISNTESIFNDVTVRGSIRASVLEYGETQAIGGALLVRPSSRVTTSLQKENSTILYLESTKGFEIGDLCRIDSNLIHNYYTVQSVTEEYVEVTPKAVGVDSYPIIDFGKQGSVGISINGSIDNTLVVPQAISVFDFNESTKTIIPRIVLGKLPDEPAYGYAAGTYGLYAENVLLKGSLVTESNMNGNFTYSGISTIYQGENTPNSDKYKKWFGDTTGEILLWAGSEGTSKEEIEDSKFFVDRNGNLFAGSGYFKGTIITDATITASTIETAKIRGSGESPALTIEDATKGIVFTANNEGSEPTVVFEVNKDSVTANVPVFNFNNNFKIGENGSLVVPNLYIIGKDTGSTVSEENTVQAIMLDKHKISYTENFKENELNGSIKGYIDFINGINFSPNGSKNTLEVTEQEIHANAILRLEESIKYGDLMEYKPIYSENELIGYDLYIE